MKTLLLCAALSFVVWTGAPGDRQEVDGGSPSR